jgi:hypothetical protein
MIVDFRHAENGLKKGLKYRDGLAILPGQSKIGFGKLSNPW